MADEISPELELKRALAQFLHDNGHGVYKPVGAYTATERGIYTNGPTLPTTGDNAIVLTTFQPVSDGRSNLLFRVQIFLRLKGSNITVGNAAAGIRADLDHKEGVPPGLNISWCESVSRLDFEPDSNQRAAVAENYTFRGRRR